MGKSIPGIGYNPVTKRFELCGGWGKMKMAIADSNRGAVIAWNSFVGSSAAITAIGTAGVSTGTISNTTGVKVGDKVFASPRTLIGGQRVIGQVLVPSNDLINFRVGNLDLASAGSMPAIGWDVFSIRTE